MNKKMVGLYVAGGIAALGLLGMAGNAIGQGMNLSSSDSSDTSNAYTPAPLPSFTTPAKPTVSATPSATPSGLDMAAAMQACDTYANAQYPYGYKPHWIVGLHADQPNAGGRFEKYDADITNAFGASRSMIVDCTVGADGSVTSFDAN